MSDTLRKLGRLAFHDTGPVPNSSTYTTIIMVHGFAWHGGNFHRLHPFAAKNNARLVFVNRRDFPGSDPYDEHDRLQLSAGSTSPEAQSIMVAFMKERARELWDFMVKFVAKEDIPPAKGNEGGIILSTWSFAAIWLTSFLANVSGFPVNDVDLYPYIRRAILYDPPCHALGIDLPEDKYHPLEDESIPPAERPLAFSKWVTGFFTHGSTPETLERRNPVANPPPTILTLTPEELSSSFLPQPAGPGGSDLLQLNGGISSGLNKVMKDKAIYFTGPEGDEDQDDRWQDVELRYLWCDRSVYEMPWGTWAFRKEIEEAEKKGLKMRKITIVCLEGANHFAHWGEPERLLRALLTNDPGAKL